MSQTLLTPSSVSKDEQESPSAKMLHGHEQTVANARDAQAAWGALTVNQRQKVLRTYRKQLAKGAFAVAKHIADTRKASRALRGHEHDESHGVFDLETATGTALMAEVTPTVDALRYLERYAADVLQTRGHGWRTGQTDAIYDDPWGTFRRPLWLMGVKSQVIHEPRGVVLIIAPSNYPFMLMGIQALQALTAGNAVIIKPAPGCESLTQSFADDLVKCGLSEQLIHVTDSSVDAVEQLIQVGVDLVVLTGSVTAGQAVLKRCAETITPSIIELSGNDAMFVLDSAKQTPGFNTIAKAIKMGLTLNHSETCIAPRRIFVTQSNEAALLTEIQTVIGDTLTGINYPPALQQKIDHAIQLGANWVVPGILNLTPEILEQTHLDQDDIFAAFALLMATHDEPSMLEIDRQSPFALGASVWGKRSEAEIFAQQINVGSVCINDLIAPTADPRLTFQARGRSGFGPTRGPEGLLAMTQPKTISTRKNKLYPHFDPITNKQTKLFAKYLRWLHG